MQSVLVAIVAFWLAVLPLPAQELSVVARLDTDRSSIVQPDDVVEITLALSKAVPWRVRLLAAPPRLIMDFREVDFSQIASVPVATDRVKAVRAGLYRPGWSRLVVELDSAYLVSSAEMQTSADAATVTVLLAATDDRVFAQEAALPEPPEWALPEPERLDAAPDTDDGRFVVVLDPGHGGIDPGAEHGNISEADLMLGFGRMLKDLLMRTGTFDVVMTRDDDIFVPLEGRISVARASAADAFISLHADALAEGDAAGAVIYTLSDDASDEAAAVLAERHDRNDLLAGVDLTAQDDLVATVLMDMARTETRPRTARLADALEEAIKTSDLKMHRFPQQSAGFSVLKSPDIPSVLIELGFLSNARDLARLQDKTWRARMAESIRNALLIWAQEDAALQGLRRR